MGYSNRAIARELKCSPSTVGNELYRGTPPRKSNKGRAPSYSAKRGQAVYKANREHCRKAHKLERCRKFVDWVTEQFREHGWSLDACVGHAKLKGKFKENEMLCTKTLYNELWDGNLPMTVTEMPEALKRRRYTNKSRQNKRVYGTSIDDRPKIAAERVEEGHWEGDTVVGHRGGKESVILTLLEKKTENYLAIRIAGKTSEAVMAAMTQLRKEYGDHFADVFKTITVDNGSEFADFSKTEKWGAKVYFAHPYTSWERPQNERHNGLFRLYVPKGASIEDYSDEYILTSADELNGRPRRKLGYHTPEDLYDIFLDRIYAIA
jgi:IS30 family transposase